MFYQCACMLSVSLMDESGMKHTQSHARFDCHGLLFFVHLQIECVSLAQREERPHTFNIRFKPSNWTRMSCVQTRSDGEWPQPNALSSYLLRRAYSTNRWTSICVVGLKIARGRTEKDSAQLMNFFCLEMSGLIRAYNSLSDNVSISLNIC